MDFVKPLSMAFVKPLSMALVKPLSISSFILMLGLVTTASEALPRKSKKMRIDASIDTNLSIQDRNIDTVYPGDTDGVSTVNEVIGAELKLRPDRKWLFQFNGFAQKYREVSLDNAGVLSGEEKYKTQVNQLFMSYRFSGGYKVSIGRQRILWGHGLAFVPTDFINPPLDPSALDLNNAKGVDSVVLDYFTAGNSYAFLVNLDDNAAKTAYGVKWTSNFIDSFDFTMVYYHSEETGNAYGLSFAGDPIALFFGDSSGKLSTTFSIAQRDKSQYRQLQDGEFTYNGQLISFAQRGDLKPESDGPYLSYLAGLNYEFLEHNFTVRAEYYHIEDAYKGHELSRIFGGMQHMASPEYLMTYNWLSALSIGRNQTDYLALTLSQESLTEGTENHFTNTLGYSIGVTQGLEDDSSLAMININSRYFDTAELTLDILMPMGDRFTEFGTMDFDWRADFGVTFIF